MTAESVRLARGAVTTVLVVCLGVACGSNGGAAPAVAGVVPLVAQGAAGLVAPGGMEQMAKPARPAMADAPAGGEPAAAAPAAPSQPGGFKAGLLKYAPSYVLLVLCVGLGLFIICRPMSRRNDEDD